MLNVLKYNTSHFRKKEVEVTCRSLGVPSRKVRSKMGNSLEQYRATIGTHFIFLMSRRYQLCVTGKFWNTILLLFYLEAIYLPTLKAVVQNYNMMRFNRLWLTQIYLYQFYIPELIQLANDIELNPGPQVSPDSVNLKAPNKNYFFIEPWNAECQSIWCSALDLPLIVKHKNCSEMVKPLDKPSKLRNQHVWGTDVEIIAASSLLETDIYVYTKVGFLYKWQRFSSSILSGHPAKNVGGLYLQNTSGVHYDIVLDVASSLTPHSNHGCKRKWNNEQSCRRKTKSVSSSQRPKLVKANHEADISKHKSVSLSNSEDLAPH